MRSVLVLNGPNLNLLGTREPAIYGSGTLADLDEACRKAAEALGLAADCRQSNHEGALIDWIHEAGRSFASGALVGVAINAGAYTHTSIALADALKGAGVPAIEVHLSNVHAREPFRHYSYLSPVVRGVIAGLGPLGYALAIQALAAGA